MTIDLETRQVTAPLTLERAAQNDDEPEHTVITGYALKYNKPSEILGGFCRFIEEIEPGALDSADMSNVVATINHDQSQVLGRSGVNLTLEPDDIGLKFTVEPTDTSFARDLVANINAGVINQCSFAFTVAPDDDAEDWQESTRDGVDYDRTIRKIDHLYDVSVVTTPAYPDTEAVVGQRSINRVREQSHSAIDKERRKLLLQYEKEELLNSL
ncbi:HK97 family phage prohead protease [Limosilactobacillus fermentum]|uniref:HK97 family phage prohead protease n=1 Tax=Limosilactobacillus fermentum TaxID=1613 RepID=UPI000F4DEE57|nr:HK97 family phage prohead protease [Limosilactobacillus fermentum]